jgi:hypothetical protein
MFYNLYSLNKLDTIKEKEWQELEEVGHCTTTSGSISALSNLISDLGFALLLDPNNLF